MAHTIVQERFSSIAHLMAALGERKPNSCGLNGSTSGNASWYLSDSYEHAEQLLADGWDEYLDRIKLKLNKSAIIKKTESIERVKFRNEIAGGVPNVGRALNGHPKSMRRAYREQMPDKLISLVYDIAILAEVDTSAMVDRGIAVLEMIAILEKLGYRVQLDIAASSKSTNKSAVAVTRMNVKSYRGVLDLKKLAFPLAHPSMFRRFIFRWRETSPQLNMGNWGYGMGSSAYAHPAITKQLKAETFAGENYFSNADVAKCGCDSLKLMELLGIHQPKN